jgi:hypothetical protein
MPLGLVELDRDRDPRLRLGLPTGRSCFVAADVGLVDLDAPRQALAPRAHHRHAEAVQHRPRRLVGAEAQHALKPQRRDTLLLASHLPRGDEPHRQRRARTVKDRPRGRKGLPATACALAPTVAQPPANVAAAHRAPPASRQRNQSK